MTTITRQELEVASAVVSQWIDDDIRNYAGLADMLRESGLPEPSVGVIVLELMSATKLAEWQNVLSGLAGRQLMNFQVTVAPEQPETGISVWQSAYTRWNTRYQQTPETEWTLGSEPTVDVVRAVKYVQQFNGVNNEPVALDIGAGDGRNSLYLAENGFHLIAVDAAQEAITRLEKRLHKFPDVQLVCTDLLEFDYPHDIELLVASYIVHLLPEPFDRLNEWSESVCPGGFIVVSSRGRLHFDPPEYWFPPAGALQHYFEMRGWDIYSTREETEYREQMGPFRHTAVVARKPL